jgi:glycosyltransferase involved in cell wall biosynthesis
MRIAVNTRFLLPGKLEGLGWHNYELCKRLVEQHPEDTFIFLFDRPFAEEFVFGPNVIPVVVPPPARHPILWYWWFEWSVPRFLRKHEADVFLSPDSYCSLRSRVPTAMITHDIAHVHYPEQIPVLVRRYYDYYVPRFLQRADHILTVSGFVKQDIERQYGLASAKITVAHNGLRGNFNPLSAKEKAEARSEYAAGENYFFYLGAVHPRKNVDRLIRAFDQFKTRTGAPVKLLIGGRMAWQTGTIKAAYEVSDHQSDIKFLGYIPDADVQRLLGGALALTYVSLFEGFGLPILEAMHAEVPVITSDRSSMPEVAGEAALLVDPEAIDDIALAMERMYQEPELGLQLIEAGRSQRANFDWDETVEKTYNVLRSICPSNH